MELRNRLAENLETRSQEATEKTTKLQEDRVACMRHRQGIEDNPEACTNYQSSQSEAVQASTGMCVCGKGNILQF